MTSQTNFSSSKTTVESLLSRVKTFHSQHKGYSFIYSEGSMVSMTLDENLPKTKIKMVGDVPVVSTKYTTAYVAFNKKGQNVIFAFNRYFSEKLNDKEVAFIFAHESLHVLLDHGRRGNDFLKKVKNEGGKVSRDVLNIAMDICINEILVREVFADYVSIMPVLDNLCFMKTIFYDKGITDVETGKGFEYYYHKIFEHAVFDPEGDLTMLGDAVYDDEMIDEMSDILDDIIEQGDIDDDNISDKLGNGKGAGRSKSGGSDVVVESKFISMSMQEVIDRFVKPRNMSVYDMKGPSKNSYNWYRDNRRMASFSRGKENRVILPNLEVERKIKKMHVVIYADVSGSVSGYTKHFMGMIEDIDTERLTMDVYVWADRVGPATKKDNETYMWKHVGGGTEIDAVLKHYKETYKNDECDSVIVLTDGGYRVLSRDVLGSGFSHEKWIFMMTEGHRQNYILKNSISVDMKK